MARTALVWLDFRTDDTKEARDFLKALETEGVLDELGFGVLQTAIADRLYPATNTVMTRARYLYFVPAIYEQLERERVTSGRVNSESRRRQDHLRAALAKNETLGVIGADAKMNVKRLPSNVYWTALRELELFLSGLSEAAYQARFDETAQARRAFEDDDRTPQAVENTAYWDRKRPAARFLGEKGAFGAGTSFRLTRTEAEDLYARFALRFSNSLLTHLVRTGQSDLDWAWQAKQTTPELATLLQHAERFSLFARGVTLQYVALVLEKREDAGLSSSELDVAASFRGWWEEARRHLPGWSPDAFLGLPDVAGHHRRDDATFLNGWLERLRACGAADELLADKEARRLVRARERAVKGQKARLRSAEHLKQWSAPRTLDGLYQLEYRHRIGSSFVREILDGLGRTA